MPATTAELNGCRLPTHVVPVNYKLDLIPNFSEFKFQGAVDITLQVKEETNNVLMHSLELDIKSVAIADTAVPFELDAENELLNVKFAEPLAPGTHVLSIAFVGIHNDKMAGFYRSKYEVAGAEKWMLCTQFEATDARRCFPCFDEPSFKATFDCSLTVSKDLVALSNMPIADSKETGDNVTHTYGQTPIMSTYLLAFVVGELEKVSGTTPEGVEVNVYTTIGKKGKGPFSLDVAISTLSYFSTYFNIAYPLPKADLVGVPDFAAGAMENWGLITFRETALLIDDENSSASEKQRVAYVVAHELAHQWFGNLVTMDWWEALWLNEGFATYAGWMAVDHRFPDWMVWEQFVSSEAAYAQRTDAMLSSHPIHIPINDAKMIDQVFDALSYQKGACVIGMLRAYLGNDHFQKGLQLYLDTHKYANATTANLWAAWASVSGEPVADIMDAWTAQMGYPVVTVEGSCSCHLRQNRFLATAPAAAEHDETVWNVPITLAYGDASSGKPAEAKTGALLLQERSSENALSEEKFAGVSGDNTFVKLNAGQAGMYRVNYTTEQWETLGKAVASGSLDAIDRLGLAGDAFALSKAGLLSPQTLMNFYQNFASERNYSVWSQVLQDLNELTGLLESQPCHAAAQKMVRELVKPTADELTWEALPTDTHTTSLLRTTVLSVLASSEDPDIIAEAQARFAKMQADVTSVHPNLREMVMAVAVAHGGKAAYDAVRAEYKKNIDDAAMRTKCFQALGKVREPELVEENCRWLLTSPDVRSNELLYGFASMSGNKHARTLAWQYVKDNWASIEEKFSSSAALVSYMIALPLRNFSSNEVADDAEAFFKAHPVPQAAMGLARALEGVRGKAEWLGRDGGAYNDYFA